MFDRLEGAFRKLSDFSSDIAHELRTPVSNLMMQTQFALAKERDVSHYCEILFANLEELKRLSRMTSDMLFLARSEHGLLRLDKHDVDLAAELNELRELFEPLADETGKTITVEGEGVVAGDSDMLRRAFSGTVAKLAMRQPFVLFKGLTFQKLCLPGAFRPGDHHNKMLRPGLCVVHASPQYL